MTRPSKLIQPDRVGIVSYYKRWREGFRWAGVILVTPWTPEPEWKTWDNAPYNPFCSIATHAYVDGQAQFLLPVFVNDAPGLNVFDGELHTHATQINAEKPAQAFFLGNDDWHYGMRFATFEERDRSLAEFGEELGFLRDQLLGHN
jgi:hypothetical protein